MENKRTETNKTVQKRLEPELKLINMDTVEVEQIEWLLYPFIPYGKVTIIQGDPGEGKTTMVLQIIAKLTRGETILLVDSTKDKRIDIDSESDMVDAENIENHAHTAQGYWQYVLPCCSYAPEGHYTNLQGLACSPAPDFQNKHRRYDGYTRQ